MYTECASTHKQLLISLFFSAIISVSLTVSPTKAADTSSGKDASAPSTERSIAITIGDQTEILSGRQLDKLFSIQSRLDTDRKYRSEIENTDLCPVERSFCDFMLSQKTRMSFKNRSVSVPNNEAIQGYVDTLNKKVSQEPVDAKFTVTDGKISVFSLNKDGSRLDTEKSVALITEAIPQAAQKRSINLTLPVVAVKPDIRSSDADNFGIVELIGEGHTNFAGSPKNRIHNFKRAIEQFNGIMVAPKEEFSFVTLLGDVDEEHGYLPELVIKKDKTEPEFGGGICQVSSTVFRAAIYSGLKITARRNHAYPVSYYKPYGMDATIYVPKPDFKFVNNTPGHILMQASIEGTQLTFRFYGTSDGRKTEIDGPHITKSNPDGSMKTIFTQKVTDAQGNITINDDFRSNYASPSKYPHPGQEPVFTEKPSDWSENQWSDYKKTRNR